MRNMLIKNLFFLGLLLITSVGQAAPTYEGYLLDASSVPITTPVTVRLVVQDPWGTCDLYSETILVDPNNEGFFSVVLGTGTLVSQATVSSTPVNVDRAMMNFGTFNGTFSGNTCNYAPYPQDSRRLSVAVQTSSGAWDELGWLSIEATSYAMSSSAVGEFKPENLLRAYPGNTAPQLTAAEISRLMSFAGLATGGDGTVLTTDASGQMSWVAPPTPSSNAGSLTTGTLPIAVLPSFAGDITSAAGTNTLTINNNVTAGTGTKVSFNAKGLITGTQTLTIADIPDLPASKVTGLPAWSVVSGTNDITTSSAVGIGTTAPSANLEVIQTTAATPALVVKAATGATAPIFEVKHPSLTSSILGVRASTLNGTTNGIVKVNGQFVENQVYQSVAATAVAVDFASGNTQVLNYTGSSPTPTFSLNTMEAGGVYNLILVNSASNILNIQAASFTSSPVCQFHFFPALNGTTLPTTFRMWVKILRTLENGTFHCNIHWSIAQ